MLRTSSSGNLKFRVWDWYNIIINPLLSIIVVAAVIFTPVLEKNKAVSTSAFHFMH